MMNENTPKQPAQAAPEKNGLLRRLFLKLDQSMKQKAADKTKQGGCCGTDKKGGGKCC